MQPTQKIFFQSLLTLVCLGGAPNIGLCGDVDGYRCSFPRLGGFAAFSAMVREFGQAIKHVAFHTTFPDDFHIVLFESSHFHWTSTSEGGSHSATQIILVRLANAELLSRCGQSSCRPLFVQIARITFSPFPIRFRR